jgi:metal-responsive CopG/Arc/MetJ family transcriptional regulator
MAYEVGDMPAVKEKKSKFTASVNARVVAKVDEQAEKLKVTRSDIVEEAMEMWLKIKAQQEEEAYFASAAAEMNADARAWNGLTSASATDTWEQ